MKYTFFLPDEYDRTAWNITSDNCRPDTRSWISGPGYPLPDTQSRIPDPESQIPYFYVAIPTFTAAFTPASTPLQPLFKYPFVEIAGVD